MFLKKVPVGCILMFGKTRTVAYPHDVPSSHSIAETTWISVPEATSFLDSEQETSVSFLHPVFCEAMARALSSRDNVLGLLFSVIYSDKVSL